MRIRSIVLLFAAMALPLAAGVTYSGGDGSSQGKAIVIKGAKTIETAMEAEHAYLEQHFPDYHVTDRWPLNGRNRFIDRIEFRMPDVSTHDVYFNVTATYGSALKPAPKQATNAVPR